MHRSRLACVLTGLLAVGLVGGCTTSEAGEAKPGPTPESTGTDSPPSETSDPPSVDIPPPPRELSLDGLDPCTLFTEAQRTQLKISDVDPGVSDGTTIYEGMKNCALDVDDQEPFVTYDIVAVTNVDVSFWLNEQRNADAELISVAGYPAAEFHTKGVEDEDCAVAIGVAKEQHLHVEMMPLSGEFTQEEICQASEQAAEMAVQTLQTLR